MNDADGGGETETDGSLADEEGFLGIADAASNDGVDVDVELGVVGKHLELLIEDFEALLGDFVGFEIVDRNLHVVEAGLVQALDALDVEQVAIGDHAGDGAGAAHADDDVVKLWVGKGLTAGDTDHGGAEAPQVIDAADHLVERDWL